MKIQRILCPVDFSEPAMQAFRYAEDLATSVGASLMIVHAFDRPATLDLPDQTVPADPAVEKKLNAIVSELPTQRFLHAGPAGRVICWMAQEQKCDLIIMGTHGRTGISHALFGSVAEFVLKHAPCPVLTIRERAEDAPKMDEPLVVPLPAPRMM